MRAGIDDTVAVVIVRQIIVGTAGIAAVESEFQHFHARIAGVFDELTHGVGQITQVFGDNFLVAERGFYLME